MTVMWVSMLILLMILLTAVQMVQKKMLAENEKWTQFECGFEAMNPSHVPFSFQFFLIALLFLIFDVEIALMLSYPLESQSMKNMALMTLFVMILSLGLIYEWQKGKIKWSNWLESISLQENQVYNSNH